MTNKINTKNLSFLDAEALRSLAHQRGECLTVLLPTTHPGAPEKDKLATLKSLLRGQKMAREMEAKLEEENLSGGGPGVVLFGRGHAVVVHRAKVDEAKAVSSDRFFLLPVLRCARLANRFMILGLSKKVLRLLQFEGGVCKSLDLPSGMPWSLVESRGAGTNDLKMKNHAPGGEGSIRFGTSASDEDEERHLEHWFGQVDEGIARVAGNDLVLLMGLDDEVAMFRRVAKRCRLFGDHIAHGINDFPLGEIAQLAGECAQERQAKEARKALDRIREWKDQGLVSTDSEDVNQAAIEGRVDVLCVGDAAGEEELVNSTVTETLCHGGDVFVLSGGAMSSDCPVTALLRY
ncbi:MAG: hypothetical protein NTW74_24305 [Acidobacteria bacterium]|nr:hypothetical protein [Acidobacteriota bacterium]